MIPVEWSNPTVINPNSIVLFLLDHMLLESFDDYHYKAA